MKNLNVYLTFSGNCREALNFYKESLNGEIASLQTFGQAPMPVPDEQKDRVMHAEFRAENVYFMASDGMPGQPVDAGHNISLSLNMDNEKEQEEVFHRLSEGGRVTMPLQDTFWGARFGMLRDKFGIHWMLNCEKN